MVLTGDRITAVGKAFEIRIPVNAKIIDLKGHTLILDVEKDLGTLVTGKLADMVAVPSNPLNDIALLAHPDFVMKGGVVVKE